LGILEKNTMLGFKKGKRTLKEQKDFVESLRGMAVALERDIANKQRSGLEMRAARLDGEKINEEDLVTLETAENEASRELKAVQIRMDAARAELEIGVEAQRQEQIRTVQTQLDALDQKRKEAFQRIGHTLVQLGRDLIATHLAEGFIGTNHDGFRNTGTDVTKLLLQHMSTILPYVPRDVRFDAEVQKRTEEQAAEKLLFSQVSRIQKLTLAQLIEEA
jgi:hypothetical protein